MGQLAEKDSRPQLPIQIHPDNIKPVNKKCPFIICPFLQFEPAQRIFFIENDEEVEALYKFGPRYTVHIQLKKQQSKKVPGIYLKLADEYVYAYKHRKLDRSDNIKPEKLLFKKRMYLTKNQVQSSIGESSIKESQLVVLQRDKLIRKFAEVKFLSLFEVGPKLGRVYNGCDGIITSEYIEYFSEVTIDKIENCIAKNSQLKELEKKLVEIALFNQGLLKNQNLSYSRWRKRYVLKQVHYYQPDLAIQNRMSYDNQSIHYIVRMFQTQITKAIMDLDNEAKMLPFINNLIFQHDFQKAISKFQQSLPMIQDDEERLQFAEQVSSMISKHGQNVGKQYEKRIQKIVTNSSIKQNSKQSASSVTTSKNTSKLSTQSNTNQVIVSPQKHHSSNEQNTDFMSPISEDGLQTNNLEAFQKGQSDEIQQNQLPNADSNQIEEKQTIIVKEKHKKIQFLQLCKFLKTSILDKNNQKSYETLNQMMNLGYRSNIEIQIMFGKLLIENARSRHALTIFQRLLYFSNEVPHSQIYSYYQIALIAGIIYFHRYAYKKALKSFQKALSILVRLRHYSIKMMTIHNNIACIFHVLKNYDQSLFHLHRGFRLGEYSVDYEYLMRSNMAMALAQKGRIKDARNQMMKINKVVQPINNMVIFCKFYSNFAYLELLDPGDNKSLDKAISNFEQACNIEEKYLIPNGYKPSIFLHNNIAMLHYKRKQFKKAKIHSQKIVNELNDVEGLVAVKVHFNIGKIFSQGYNYDLPLKHFHQAKILLSKLDENRQPAIRSYKEVINKEIQELEKMRIDEVSEEESYKFSYMSSSLLKKV